MQPWEQNWSGQPASSEAAPWERQWGGAPVAKPEEDGDFIRGGKEAFQQLPQMGYGLIAGAGAIGEKVFGEGGIATGVKQAGLKGYTEWADKMAAQSKPSDSWSYSYDKAKDGDFGALVDWLQHGIGYAGAQGIQALATAGIGAAGGKLLIGAAADKLASGMVAKEAARLAAENATVEATKRIAADQIMGVAVKNVASKLGQLGAVGALATGQEGGEIFGGLVQKAEEEGTQLSGGDLARAFGATLAAGGLEFVGDKLGLDVLLGRSKLVNPAKAMTGLGGRAARGVLAGAAVAPAEAATEYFQTGLEEYGKGTETNPLPWLQSPENQAQAFDAAALGGLGGAMVSGAGGAIHGAQTGKREEPVANIEDIATAPSIDEAIIAADKAVRGEPTRGERVANIKAELSDLAIVGDLRTKYGDDGFSQLLTSLNQANNPRTPEATREKHLQAVETALFNLRASVDQPTQTPLLEGQQLPMLTGPDGLPLLGDVSTPTGTMRAGPDGVAVPETAADLTETMRARDERTSLGEQQGQMPDDVIPMGMRQEQPAWTNPRSKTPEPTIIDALNVPNAVNAYVDKQRAINTPMAHAFVQAFDSGRITPADVAKLIVQTQQETPNDRIAAAAATAPQTLQQRLEAFRRAPDATTIETPVVASRPRPKGAPDAIGGTSTVQDMAQGQPEQAGQPAAAPAPGSADALPVGVQSEPDAALSLRERADAMRAKNAVPAQAAPPEQQALTSGRVAGAGPAASWVIREKATGKVIAETFDRKKVDALNVEKYEAVPIAQHLASLNARKVPEDAPQTPATHAAPEKPRVFKSRKNAERERDRLGNEHKLQKIKGGFILRRKTDKEMAAEARAGRRFASGAASGLRRSLLATIAAGGGININERPDTIGEGNRNVGGRMVFTRAGKTINQWAETLAQSGFIPPGEVESDDGVRWLQDAISEEFAGRREHFAMDDEARMEEAARAAQGEEPALGDEPFGPLSDFDLEELSADGYAGASPEVQALTEQALAAADEAGIDIEALREDAARLTEGLSDDEYHAQLQASARAAIAQTRADAARRDAGADQASKRDRGAAADTQGDEGAAPEGLTLEAQDAKSLREKTEREATAKAAEAKQKADEQRRLEREAVDRETRDRARQDASAENFVLGQDANDALAGQGSIFDAPAEAVAPLSKNDREVEAGDDEVSESSLLDADASRVLVKETVRERPTKRQNASPYARFAVGEYVISVQQFPHGPGAVLHVVRHVGDIRSVERAPNEMLEDSAFSSLNDKARDLFARERAGQSSIFDAPQPDAEAQAGAQPAPDGETAARKSDAAAPPKQVERDERDRSGLNATDRRRRDLDAAAAELAGQIANDMLDGQYATPAERSEIAPGLRHFAEQAGVPADDLRQEVLKRIRADERLTKRQTKQIVDAMDPTRQSKQETAAPAKPIADVGEKIGGSRKDKWAQRGLNAADLDEMSESEGAQLVTKANVWKPDYAGMVSDGATPQAAALVKVIFDSLAAKPRANTPQGRRDYVTAMQAVRSVYGAVKTEADATNAVHKLRDALGLNARLDGSPAAQQDARRVLFSVYKGRSDPFAIFYNEKRRASKLVEAGFPGVIEPWTRQFTVRGVGGDGITDAGVERYLRDAEQLGTPLTEEQLRAGAWWVGGKGGNTVAYAATKADAEAAAKTIYDASKSGGEKAKEPQRPHLDEIERDGLERAIDRDVTAGDFINDFGFRGIEWGNWAAQDERQRIANFAYDALADLARILNLPHRALSLNGTMGMAFGARGGGRFAAHYEAGKLVINMTKLRGAGSLAHEWAHAFDHYIGELDQTNSYQGLPRGASGWDREAQYNGVPIRTRTKDAAGNWTNTEARRLANLRPELAERIDDVMRALFTGRHSKADMLAGLDERIARTERYAAGETDNANLRKMYESEVEKLRAARAKVAADPDDKTYPKGRSKFAAEAQRLSGKSSSGYWLRPTEMFARAFEAYVFDRLVAMGAKSDYLVHGVEADRYASGDYKGNPYPTGEERATINRAFDALVAELKTREGEGGGVALYSVAGAPGQTTREALRQRLTDEFGADVVDALEKAGLLRIADTPPSSMPADAAGVTEGERIGLFAGNTPAGSTAVAYHEALHATLRRMIGDAAFDALMQRMPLLAAGNRKWFAEAADRIPADTPKAARNSELASYAVEQYQLAREAMPAGVRKWVQDFIAAIKVGLAKALQAAGVGLKLRVRLLSDAAVLHKLARDGLRTMARDNLDSLSGQGVDRTVSPAFSSVRPEDAERRGANTRQEIRLAHAAHARIVANNGVASADDLRDMLRVPGYSQWAQSALVGNVDSAAAVRRELADAFPGTNWQRPILNAQGVITFYGLGDNREQALATLTAIADRHGAPIAVRGHAQSYAQDLRDAGFIGYSGMQEVAGRPRDAMIQWIRPAGGIGENTPLFSIARTGDEANALKALSDNDELFALPKSTKDTVEGIAADIDPQIKVTAHPAEGLDRYTLTMPDGKTAELFVRTPSEFGPHSYGTAREGEPAETVRPGEDQYNMRGLDDVWINVSRLEPGGGGARIYAIAGDFAHNTGRVFIGDPAGVSPIAKRRRSEAMLSSALRWGTTEHLAPHPMQVRGDKSIGVPPLRWVEGDDLGNIRNLIDVNLKALDNAFPSAKQIEFDVATGQFRNAVNGRPLDRLALRERVRAMRSSGASGASMGEAGGNTIARGAVWRALLREAGGTGETGGRRDGLLARLARLGSDAPQAVSKLFARGEGKSTAQALRAALESEFGADTISALERAGLLTIADKPAANMPQDAAGVTENGRIGLFADNTAPGSTAVAYHEALHATLRASIGDAAYDALMARMPTLASGNKAFFAEANKRIPANTPASVRAEEQASYAVEAYQKNREAMPAGVRKFVQDLIAAFKAGLAKALQAAGVGLKLRVTLLSDAAVLHKLARDGLRTMARETGQGAQRSLAPAFSVAPQTDSAAFKKWFGASVVTETGKAGGVPLVVYHGTTGDLTAFDLSFSGSDGVAYDRPAIFATDDASVASDYARNKRNRNIADAGRAFQRFKNQNPGVYDDEYERLFDAYKAIGRREGWDLGVGANVMPLYLSIQNPLEVDGRGERFMQVMPEAVKRASTQGRDGVIVRNVIDHASPASEYPVTVYVAFRPEQIKSASGNSGAFDATNPDIRYSIAGTLGSIGGGTKMAGRTSRQHTPDQQRAMRNVGRIVEKPTLEQRVKELWKDAGMKLAQGLVDQFAPIKAISDKAYGLMRLSKGASGAFEAFLNGGMLKLTDGVYDFDETKRGGVVETLLQPLQGEHHDFLWWVAANRAERLASEGKENLFSDDDIDDLKSLADGTTDFDYTIQNGARAGQTTRDRSLIYEDSLKTFNSFNENVLDMAEQSGLIDGASRAVWEHEFYVPFYRVADEDGGVRGMSVKGSAVRQEAFKTLKGGRNALNNDLLDNTLMNWAHLLDASAKNRAAVETLNAAESVGAAISSTESAIRDMSAAMQKKNGVVWVMEGGEKHFYLIEDPHLVTALTALDYAGMKGPVMDAMGTFKRVLTIGVTASPFFKVRNLIRDSIQAIGTGDIGYNAAANIAQGWKLTSPKSDAYFRLLAGGGTIHFGTMTEGNEGKRIQALVESGVDRSTILSDENSVKAFYRRFIEPGITAYNELGNRGEAINRASLYAQLRAKGVNHAEASLQARDLMDFSMQGSFTTVRFLTQVVPFFNARIQGLYKLGRSTKADPARMGIVLGATAAASLALLLAYSDDDDWKKREDWDRNNFWWFKFGGTAFRIPKPFEIGAIASLAERGFELAFSKEMTSKRFGQNVLELLGNNLSMNPVPQLVKPMLDVYANLDSFTGRPVESMGMERLRPEYRFTGRSSMLARGASTAANAVTNKLGFNSPSPVQIDHMLRGYFGWLGAFIIGASEIVVRPATGQVSQPMPDLFRAATGNMVSDLRDAPSRYVSQMYDQARELEEAYGTWRALLKSGKTEEAAEFRADNRDELNRYRFVERVKSDVSKINQRIRAIEQSDLGAMEKRLRIREANVMKDRLARRLEVH